MPKTNVLMLIVPFLTATILAIAMGNHKGPKKHAYAPHTPRVDQNRRTLIDPIAPVLLPLPKRLYEKAVDALATIKNNKKIG